MLQRRHRSANKGERGCCQEHTGRHCGRWRREHALKGTGCGYRHGTCRGAARVLQLSIWAHVGGDGVICRCGGSGPVSGEYRTVRHTWCSLNSVTRLRCATSRSAADSVRLRWARGLHVGRRLKRGLRGLQICRSPACDCTACLHRCCRRRCSCITAASTGSWLRVYVRLHGRGDDPQLV